MKIRSYKIDMPDECDVSLDSDDIANWFKEASPSDVQEAINSIGLVLSKRDFKEVSHRISGTIAPKSKNFWKMLIEKMHIG